MAIAAIYCRVSSTDQKDNGTSLETQEAAARVKAAQLGLTVLEEYVICEDWSGTDLERPGLLRLLYLAEAGLIEVVIILCSDRLYRPEIEGDEWRIFPILQRFMDAGVELVWTDPGMPSHGPMASIITFINSWKSGEERRDILRRTRTGRLAIARKGGLLGGFTPYGYSYVPKTSRSLAKLIINEGQARIIRHIYRWLVEEKLSCRAIGQRLTEMGIPTPQSKSVWQPSVVNHMLKQEVYCGVMYFNRREPVKPQQHRTKARSSKTMKTSRRLRPQEEWIPIPVPAIIDRAIWERAQEQLKANSHFSPRNNTRHDYLLRGLVHCGICGKAYSGATFKRREREYQYYVCNQRYPTPGEGKCTAPHVPLALLENLIWDTVAGIVHDPGKLAEEYESRRHPSGNNNIDQERKRIEGEIRRLDNATDGFLDLYGDAKFDRSKLDQKVDQVASQRKAVLEQLQALDLRQQQETDQRYRWESLQAFCDTIKVGLGKLTDEERRQVLRLLVQCVRIKGKSVRIELAVPLDDSQAVYRLRPTRPPPSLPRTQSHFVRALVEGEGFFVV